MSEANEPVLAAENGHRSLGPVATIGLAALGFFVPAAVIVSGAWPDAESMEFLKTPEAVIWILSNCAAFSLMPIVWADSVATTAPMRRGLSAADWTAVSGFSALVMAAFLLPNALAPALLDQGAIPLDSASERLFALSLLASLGFVLPTAGALAVSARTADAARRKKVDAASRSYFRARDAAQGSLAWLSLGLSLMVVIYASFRRVSIAATESDYPVSLLLAVSALTTALVALAYFSAMAPIKRLGFRIRDRLAPMPELAGDWVGSWEQRKRATELLELDVPASRRFVTALSVSAPFVSGLIASLIDRA